MKKSIFALLSICVAVVTLQAADQNKLSGPAFKCVLGVTASLVGRLTHQPFSVSFLGYVAGRRFAAFEKGDEAYLGCLLLTDFATKKIIWSRVQSQHSHSYRSL